MTELTISIGTTFLIPSGTATDSDIKHLFIICTDIDKNGNTILAPISSWKNNLCDATCKLEVGCHEFVRIDSYILYRKCRIENLEIIQRGLDNQVIVQLDDIKPEICNRIIEGISRSKQTPWQIKRHLKRQNTI